MINVMGKCDQQQDQIFTPKEHKVSGNTYLIGHLHSGLRKARNEWLNFTFR